MAMVRYVRTCLHLGWWRRWFLPYEQNERLHKSTPSSPIFSIQQSHKVKHYIRVNAHRLGIWKFMNMYLKVVTEEFRRACTSYLKPFFCPFLVGIISFQIFNFVLDVYIRFFFFVLYYGLNILSHFFEIILILSWEIDMFRILKIIGMQNDSLLLNKLKKKKNEK